ncbi:MULTISPECIES: UDP-N-acetylmuramate--L-alanine ligase [unclassified Lentimicrobium]|uniref:UDP-N-acetylmuramate--L-alanine ligase n=1 Tax=unclassified Lentimicrobium TaxID=2677434 RepID=UPI0015567463|nr:MULTISPECIES: Mur ligase family protein [unclassified Lentimicrobium]NPD45328.1 peptidoglycan synthetase [Lentimicrobium sp. S6]NPD84373.1 peptidoglycan synthetase [Lentimicrobium sp. L6]
MNYHFIAIGGAAMHNLAIALHLKGNQVTGSDDEIFEPSKGRLDKYNLLPKEMGWQPKKINSNIDAIILGMHARADNPELAKAKELGLEIYSYPEFLYEQSKDKTRIVIGGSHGKTTITAMILHVLDQLNIKTDYMVGSKLEGFEVMVKLSDAPYIVLEGDEYLSSPIDRRPKFHLYHPHIALLSGVAWDHINVFPTFDIYLEQFEKFIGLIEKDGSLIYCSDDKYLADLYKTVREDVEVIAYDVPEFTINADDYKSKIKYQGHSYSLSVFGKHNLMNLEGARRVCEQIGVETKDFYNAISSFTGASNRLETIGKNDTSTIYKDFAHSPSKLKATTTAVKEQFTDRKLFACMELHTFSSLNSEFLKEYRGAMDKADVAIVYFNPHTIAHKRLESISEEQVKQAFAREDLVVFTDSKKLLERLYSENWENQNLLLMSSGNFDGVDYAELVGHLL